ncbi:hypothetical protein B9Z19DRAFT_1068742 [Tuber borchii]|uniref:Uncharacterized protein n=1 Tax=Tuber borchii TaxID=42251 RepID=A0A2T6ZE11_TUBBO|nr:hypothetical protein B9Z19DRAFT_1068742 [Tuber borchii]
MDPGIVPGVIMTLWNYALGPSPDLDKKHFDQPKLKTAIETMDTGMSGPGITPLPAMPGLDMTEMSIYITNVLQLLDRQDAYGILAGVHQPGGPTVPTFIFGLPKYTPHDSEIILPQAPHNIPVWIRDDCILMADEDEEDSDKDEGELPSWAMAPVTQLERLKLEGCSLGVERSMTSAGSFGGFLKRTSEPAIHYGITAAHCVSPGLVGMPLCSPSTVEVTSRIKQLIRYTTLCPLKNRLHITHAKEMEVHQLLQQSQFHPIDSGWSILKDTTFRILLPQSLASQGLIGQFLPAVLLDIGDLYPGAIVAKMGRSTGATCGVVNGAMLQHWENGASTHEIAIIGHSGETFANRGDSGGCVFTLEGEEYKASGMLIGKVRDANISFATPLRLILQSAGDYEWA